MINEERMYQNLLRLVAEPSVSGTQDEVRAALKLEELLLEIPYFQAHRENVMRIPIEGDPFDRCLVAAYVETAPQSADAIILTGHYDVVDIEDFGHLKAQAYDVEEITRRISELPLDAACRKDLESGEWLFGRGTADMKIGHALCLELLRHYAEEGGINGNLLYVAVCGEETNSEGMLAATSFFNRFAEEHHLRYKALLLTECFMVDGAEEGVKYIQYGAAGKIMPMFFCVGKATHGEEPLLGLDANLLSAEVYRLMHLNPAFCQQNHGVSTAPPAGLKLQDLKGTYSLSTALYAASYYNIATIKLEPEALMEKLKAVGEQAFANALADIDARIKEYTAFTGSKPEAYRTEPCVKTFREIFDAVEKTYPGDLTADLRAFAEEEMQKEPEIQATCVKLVKRLYDLYEDKRPMIIISVIPPYYPDVNIDTADADTAAMLEGIQDLIGYAQENFGETLKTSEYYGISDLCYTWLADGMDFDALFNNLVGKDMLYQLPEEDLKKFKVPGVVIGGYGKDMHKYTERLNLHYNFAVLPKLYLHFIDRLLAK